MAGTQHCMGLGLQGTELGPRARRLLQNERALLIFVQVPVLSASCGWSSAKSLCWGAPKPGCAFLQPGTAWKAWRAGSSGLRKDFISTGRSKKQKELGRKQTGWLIDAQRGLAFQGGERESPDRDIMPAWQGQVTDVTHGSSAALGTAACWHILSNSSDWHLAWKVIPPAPSSARASGWQEAVQVGFSLESRRRIRDQHATQTCEGALLQHYLFSPQDHVFLTPSLEGQQWCSGAFPSSVPALQA